MLTIPHIPIVQDLGDKRAPDGIVYSTKPRLGLASDSKKYVYKGGLGEMVAAEIVGHAICDAADVRVPAFGVSTDPTSGDRVFMSLYLETLEPIDPFIASANWTALSRVFAIDVLLANTDRNPNNFLVVCDPEDGQPDLIPIDFERSQVVRLDHPLIQLADIPPFELRPKKALLDIVQGRVRFTPEALAPLKALGDETIGHIVAKAFESSGLTRDASMCATAIVHRRDRIERLVAEVWDI